VEKPYFIGIAGESGVGKSTISDVVRLYLGSDVLHLSTDDLHKWERTNHKWEEFTHLNPNANNLDLGDIQIGDLAEGKFIYRSSYNHITGYFDPPNRTEPRRYIINEGLHAFYTEAMGRLISLKIFVDTDELLRTHWKVIRDTEQRGYKYNDVIDAINRRKDDGRHVRERQINIADAIIRITTAAPIKVLGCKKEKVVLEMNCVYRTDEACRYMKMLEFVRQFMLKLDNPSTTPIPTNIEGSGI